MTDGTFNGAVREAAAAPPAVTSCGSEHLANALVLEQAQSAIAFQTERADRAEARAGTAETELAALADRLGAAVRAAAEGERERAEKAEAKLAEYENAAGTAAPGAPAGNSLTPAEASVILGIPVRTVAHLESRGKLTAGRTIGGHHRYDEGEVRALRARRDALASGELLTMTGVAKAFRVAPGTVFRWAKAGKVTPVPGPGRRLFRAADVRALLAGTGEGGGGRA